MKNYINVPDLPKEGMRKYYVIASQGTNYYMIASDAIENFKYTYSSMYNEGIIYGYNDSDFYCVNNKTKIWQKFNPSLNRNFLELIDEVLYCNFDFKGGNNDGTTKLRTPLGAEIELSQGSTLELKEGMVYNLQNYVNILPKGAIPRVTYESSNPDICTIDEYGNIKALKEGECVITLKNYNL